MVARGRPCGTGLRDAVFAAHASGQSTRLLLERELGRVVDLLGGAGVEPVVMKGPVSAPTTTVRCRSTSVTSAISTC